MMFAPASSRNFEYRVDVVVDCYNGKSFTFFFWFYEDPEESNLTGAIMDEAQKHVRRNFGSNQMMINKVSITWEKSR